MPAAVETIDRPSIDWPARQAVARIPFHVVGSAPVNPVQPDLTEGQGGLWHWGERPCGDVAVFVTVAGDVVSVDAARYVPDPRASRNAWPVTTLVVVDLGVRDNFPATRAGSDLDRVAWFPARPLAQLEESIRHAAPGGRLFDAHRAMLTDLLGVA